MKTLSINLYRPLVLISMSSFAFSNTKKICITQLQEDNLMSIKERDHKSTTIIKTGNGSSSSS